MPVDASIKDDNYRIDASQLIYGGFVKLNVLDQLVYDAFSETSVSSSTDLNIFIDVNSIIHALYSEHFRVNVHGFSDIAAGLINMCAHYRSFFSRLRVKTKFYIVQSLNTCEINRKFISGYNESFYQKSQLKSSIAARNGLEILKVLCPYLPDIFYIETENNWEVSVIIANLIEAINDGHPNMIISKDLYSLQLTGYYKNTTFLYPLKHPGEDVSRLITINEKATYRTEFWNLVCYNRKISTNLVGDLSPINYPLFNAITRCPERGVKALYRAPDARKIILSIAGNSDIRILPEQLMNCPLVNNYSMAAIVSRMKALDIMELLPYYKSTAEAKNIKLINLRDDATVNQINAKYFADNPIDLQKL